MKEDYLNEYVIPIQGLSAGVHSYQFKIDKKFFENIEYSEFENGDIKLYLELIKDENMITLNFIFEGGVIVNCDRCNDLFLQQISGKERLIIKYDGESNDDTEDIISISQETGQFDISKYVYEFLSLLIPLRRVHPDDENGNTTCNQEVLKKLNEYSDNRTTDPRWDALKELKNKTNKK